MRLEVAFRDGLADFALYRSEGGCVYRVILHDQYTLWRNLRNFFGQFAAIGGQIERPA